MFCDARRNSLTFQKTNNKSPLAIRLAVNKRTQYTDMRFNFQQATGDSLLYKEGSYSDEFIIICLFDSKILVLKKKHQQQ
jgi:hypothetical protein